MSNLSFVFFCIPFPHTGKVKNKRGDFAWLDECVEANFSNFHTNGHQFNLENGAEEYLVLSSSITESSNKRRERGLLWCSFNPRIMFYAICEHYRSNARRPDCSRQLNFAIEPNKNGLFHIFTLQESSESPYTRLSKTQAYLIIASVLMFVLLIGMIIILRARYVSSLKSNEIEIPVQNQQMDMSVWMIGNLYIGTLCIGTYHRCTTTNVSTFIGQHFPEVSSNDIEEHHETQVPHTQPMKMLRRCLQGNFNKLFYYVLRWPWC